MSFLVSTRDRDTKQNKRRKRHTNQNLGQISLSDCEPETYDFSELNMFEVLSASTSPDPHANLWTFGEEDAAVEPNSFVTDNPDTSSKQSISLDSEQNAAFRQYNLSSNLEKKVHTDPNHSAFKGPLKEGKARPSTSYRESRAQDYEPRITNHPLGVPTHKVEAYRPQPDISPPFHEYQEETNWAHENNGASPLDEFTVFNDNQMEDFDTFEHSSSEEFADQFFSHGWNRDLQTDFHMPPQLPVDKSLSEEDITHRNWDPESQLASNEASTERIARPPFSQYQFLTDNLEIPALSVRSYDDSGTRGIRALTSGLAMLGHIYPFPEIDPEYIKYLFKKYNEKSEEPHQKYVVLECFESTKLAYFNTKTEELGEVLANDVWKCPECPKGLRTKYNLERHLKVHGERKRYKCTLCDSRYYQWYNVQRHLRESHGPNPESSPVQWYICEKCGMKFVVQRAFTKHKRIHTTMVSGGETG